MQRIGAAGAAWMLGARVHTAGHADAMAKGQARSLRFFTPAEAREVGALAERIIPSDDGPGAKEAGVLYFIDYTLTTIAKDLQAQTREGLEALSRAVRGRYPGVTRFSQLSTAQQDALLHSIEDQDYFQLFRDGTVAGMLSLPSYGGNRNYVGWRAIGLEGAGEYAPPFGYYDRPEVRRRLLGTEGE